MAPVNHHKGNKSKAVKVGTRGAKRAALTSSEPNKLRKQRRGDVSDQPDKSFIFVKVEDDAFMIDAHVSKENEASTATMATRRIVKGRQPPSASSNPSDDDDNDASDD